MQATDTHLLIIGNGPAGLSLSSFLSGLKPYYNPERPHPDPVIHERMNETDLSMLEQDLDWCTNMDEMGGSSRPLSVLFDSLVRPGADTGQQGPSCLVYEKRRCEQIPHLVLGDTPVGGSWNDYDPQMLAVSFASWLELPGYTISEYLGGSPLIPRLPSVVIASYLDAYAKKMGLRKHLRPLTKVTSIRKDGDVWRTKGHNSDGRPFEITSDKVVLACGKTQCRKLGLPKEEDCIHIVYDVPSLKARIEHDIEQGEEYTTGAGCCRVTVVGDGISSADVIRYCLEKDIPVLHVMRRNDRQLRNILMARLSATHYHEYNQIHRLMTGRDKHPLYERCPAATIESIEEHGITIRTSKGTQEEQFGLVAVCIGRVPDMDGILPPDVSFSSYFEDNDPSLMAVGSFAGDHFVRYVVGGSLEVARKIHSDFMQNNNHIKC